MNRKSLADGHNAGEPPQLINGQGQAQQSRPPNRLSVGIRYGDMRSQLQEAAILRQQRMGKENEAPLEHASQSEVVESNRSGSGELFETGATLDDDLRSNRQSQADSGRNNNTEHDYNAAIQQMADDLELGIAAHRQAQQDQANNENWNTCIGQPTDEWKNRKCSLMLHCVAMFFCVFSENPECGIPQGPWLAVCFFFLCLETLFAELRQRMEASSYWHGRRRLKKSLLISATVLKELLDFCWMIYGTVLFFSKEAEGCQSGFNFLMGFFLLIACIKLLLFAVVIGIMVYICVQRGVRKANERAASNDILRSLGRIKYSALSIGRNEPDVECAICFVEYGEDDIVTSLACNEKHVFHEECIAGWIQQGKNSCPICRAVINSDVNI